MTIVVNLIIAGFIALFSWLSNDGVGMGTSVLFAVVFLLSLPARIVQARHLEATLHIGRKQYGKLLLIPLYMYAIVIDLFAISLIFQGLQPEGGRLSSSQSVLMIGAMGGSVACILWEAIILSSGGGRRRGGYEQLSSVILVLYAGMFGSLVWMDRLPSLQKAYTKSATEGLLQGLLFYLILILPFERGVLLRQMERKTGWLLVLAGLAIGYVCVIWTIMPD